jgi:hypothetical protein
MGVTWLFREWHYYKINGFIYVTAALQRACGLLVTSAAAKAGFVLYRFVRSAVFIIRP